MTASARRVVAITGATGFTGGALARRLRDSGYQVRALARKVPDRGDDGIEWVQGELDDLPSLAALMAGADTCFHIAAMYRTEGPAESFFAVNATATAALLEMARRAAVRRFVYCSSIGVHGSVETTVADEEAPLAPRDPYQQSKALAEAMCAQAISEGGLEIVIIRPCGIYGPGDTRMLKMFSMIQRGTFVLVGSGGSHFHPVYIDDLVEGFVLAMNIPEAQGNTFIIGGAEHLPLKDFVAAAASALGLPPPRRRVPYRLMEAAAGACEAVCAPLKIEPPLHRRRLTFFKHHRAFDIGRARRQLGYLPKIGLDEGFRRTVAWYREQGMLR